MKSYALGFLHAFAIAIAWFIMPEIIGDKAPYALGWILSVFTLIGWVIYLVLEGD